MTTRRSYAIAAAALLGFAGAGCASRQRESMSPVARQVEVPQQQSEQALARARDAQARAADQERRFVAAQQQVEQDRRQLQQDQARARQETATARRLQSEANLATDRAARVAEEAQRQATRALQRQASQVSRGEATATGYVTRATADEVVLQPRSGSEPLAFRVGAETRVVIDDRVSRATEIRQGQDALVSYDVTGKEPVARVIQIRTGQLTSPGGRGQDATPPANGPAR